MSHSEIPVFLQDWPLQEKDITPDLCKRCGLCCELTVSPNTEDPRQLEFYRVIAENHPDITFSDGSLSIKCSHLKQTKLSDTPYYECSIYEDRPQLCRDYNCVSWAKVANDTSRYDQVLEIVQLNSNKIMEDLEARSSTFSEGLQGPDL